MKRAMTIIAGTAAALALSQLSVLARDAEQRRVPPPPRAPAASQFYPQDIEGGVKGNLPFNNQIRKHTDPLNANGGR